MAKIKTDTSPGSKGKITANKDWSWHSLKLQALLLATIGLIFYCNTFQNEAALDDSLVITDNEYVQQGLSGIPAILTSDAYASEAEKQHAQNVLAGGRYRPLSIVTFAIEQQILGKNETNNSITSGNVPSPELKEKIAQDMHIRHVINVLLYISSIIVLLVFLRDIIFRGNVMAAFFAALIFLILPVHTEVVANVKSRDELLSLLFIGLTFIYSFRYYNDKRKKNLLLSLIFYFLALLSKEYAVSLVILLPLAVFIFRKESYLKSIRTIIPLLVPLALYGILRIGSEKNMAEAANNDIMNAPYLYASASQKLASELYVLLQYARLLIFPHPLSADYSYAAIPYHSFDDATVWLAVAIYIFLTLAMLYGIQKRTVWGFALAFYLINLFLISNIPVNIGAPMGERLIYHSSFGYAILIGLLLTIIYRKTGSTTKAILVPAAIVSILVVLCGYITIDRNKDWKNNQTLFLKDVHTVPNSVLANSSAGAACLDLGNDAADSAEKQNNYLEGIKYFDKAISIAPKYILAYVNRAVCYYKTGDADSALADMDTVRHYSPGNPNLPYMYQIVSNFYFDKGMKYGRAQQPEQAMAAFARAADAAPGDTTIWYDLGYAAFQAGDYTEAVKAWDQLNSINPRNQKGKDLYVQAKAQMR